MHTPSPWAVSLETIHRTIPKLWEIGSLFPPWNILMENSRAFLMLTNITRGPAQVTDHGLVVPNLGINYYREFSLTFAAQAVAPAET